jgi:hypothetical protein
VLRCVVLWRGVAAFHPSQRRLSRGVVIAVGDGQYQVDFIDKQMNANLGGIWVADTDLMTHEPRSSFAADYPGQESPRTPTRAGSGTPHTARHDT